MLTQSLVRKLPHVGRVARATRWRRVAGRPRVWAHRGASALVTENTLEAFEAGKSAGADGIELDVRLDADGEVVVFHDDNLERLASRSGSIESLSTHERKQVRVTGGYSIPDLATALKVCAPLEVNVELKTLKPLKPTGLGKAVAAVIAASGMQERILVSSFDPVALLQFHAALPAVAIAFLFHQQQNWTVRSGWFGRALGASALHPQSSLCTSVTVPSWQRSGHAVNAWTVNDPLELKRLADLGIDGFFVDDPARALEVLRTQR